MALKSSVNGCNALPVLFTLLISLITALPAYSASRTGIRVAGLRLSPKVESMADLRWKKLTRQGWDMSCGAAALSTLLTYHQGREYSEMAVTLTILKNSDPAVVRERGGFSLYDLKRFVRAVGLEGVGYGVMTLDDLEAFAIPAILPVRIGGLDHFVIFKKRVGGHVMLGDPAFGNLTLSADRFEKMWQSRIAFYVVTAAEKETMTSLERSGEKSPLAPELAKIAIPDLHYGARILRRIPTLPLTRRMTAVAP